MEESENRPQRKLHRLTGYDYSQNGAYFVTVCTRDKRNLLCQVGNAVPGVPVKVTPTAIGAAILAAWEKLGNIDPSIHVDKFCLMPNHIHGIIMIDRPPDRTETERRGRRSLPDLVRGFKSVTTREYNRLVSLEEKNRLWQGSYYDEIIRSEAHYRSVWQYIDSNPAKWAKDEYYSESSGFPHKHITHTQRSTQP